MRALAIDVRTWLKCVEIDTRNRVDRVDGRERIGATTPGGPGRYANVGDVRSQLYNDRRPRLLFHPRRNLLAVLRHLPYSRPHAALTHAMRASKVKFKPVGTGGLRTLHHCVHLETLVLDHMRSDDNLLAIASF